MPLTDDQRNDIRTLLGEGLSSDQIAEKVGVPMRTVAAFRANLSRISPEGDADEEIVDAIEATFGLERDLQLALRANIEQLETGLKIIDGGKEQTVDSGRIDITAEDSKGITVVIELKVGLADRQAVAQILAYMGDLMITKKSVKGILVAGEFPARTIAAARAVPSLELKRYSFKFSFESVGKSPENQ